MFPRYNLPMFGGASYPHQLQLQAAAAQQLAMFSMPLLQQPTYLLPASFNAAAAMISGGPRALPRRAAPIEKPPMTTAFIGNIHDRCSNDLIRSMLQECGNVVSWKRIQGSNGKYKAFGYCEFDHPETTLRTLRILQDWPLGHKKLVVKVDEKTRNTIIEFTEKKRKALGKPVVILEGDQLPCDPEMTKDDPAIAKVIEELIRREEPDLTPQALDDAGSRSPRLQGKGGNLDISSLDREKKEYIAREISHFRETYKEDPKKDSSEKDWGSSSRRQTCTPRSPSRASRSASPSSVSSQRSSSSDSDSSRASSRRSQSSASPPVRVIRTDRGSQERKKADKEQEEKDEAYLERLRKWESREKKKSKVYARRRAQDRIRRRDELGEAAKLKEFLEDYEDERDDGKFYRGSALFQRRREYDMERQQDLMDEQLEKEELDEMRQQLLSQGIGDVENEVVRRQKLQEQKLLTKLRASESPSPTGLINAARGGAQEDELLLSSDSSPTSTPSSSRRSTPKVGVKRKRCDSPGISNNTETIDITESVVQDSTNHIIAADSKFIANALHQADIIHTDNNKKMGFNGIKLTLNNASTKPSGIFVEADDWLLPQSVRDSVDMNNMTSQQRKRLIRDMIERIPTDKDALFNFNVHWDTLDKALIDKRVLPWVSKKISEYIGEDQKELVEFVCDKLGSRVEPHTLLQEIGQVLDDEAHVFVVKLWRLIIYEIEAKRIGLPHGR